MSDQSPLDLSNFQLVPDWLKENPKKQNFSNEEKSRDKNKKKEIKRKQWNKGKNKNFSRNKNVRERPERVAPPKGIKAEILPCKASLKQIADQIKKTARSYSVFEIAKLILSQRERYEISFTLEEPKESELYFCSSNNSLWLSKKEAMSCLLGEETLLKYYDKESVEVEPPKGNYQSIGICGISGTTIGPPNHHSYQKEIINLHKSKFSNIDFESYKNKIKIENSEELVDEWKKSQSFQDQYSIKGEIPNDDKIILKNREDAESHFLKNYSEKLIDSGESFIVPGNIEGKMLSQGLLSLIKNASIHAKKHPASLVNPICTILGNEGLKFFKRGKKIFACVTRPKPLSDDDTLSDPIKAIVTFIREKKRVTSKELLDELAPSGENSDNSIENNSSTDESNDAELGENQLKVLQDLNWLLREGAVIAFGDGKIELAIPKQPGPKVDATESNDKPIQ